VQPHGASATLSGAAVLAIAQTRSLALQLPAHRVQALYRSGHSLTEEKTGVTHELDQLLAESGCQQVQTKDYALEFVAGTVGGQNFYQNMMYGFQTWLPFLQKWGCASEDYDALCEQAMIEM
jgi:hypothetical protein